MEEYIRRKMKETKQKRNEKDGNNVLKRRKKIQATGKVEREGSGREREGWGGSRWVTGWCTPLPPLIHLLPPQV